MYDIPVIDDTQVPKENKRSGIQLCYPFEEKRLYTWRTPYIIQPKLDGVRCRALFNYDRVTLISSEGHCIDHVPHINEALMSMFDASAMELDGELYVHGMNFQDIISRTSRSKNTHADAGKIEYHIFDVINGQAQVDRLSLLNKYGFYINKDCIKIVPSTLVRDIDEIMTSYHRYLEDGYEGFVIRDIYGLYQRKRYTGMMKYKPHQIDDYTISGYSHEIDIQGNPKMDVLGRIICASTEEMPWLGQYSPYNKIPEGYFGVGTGFTYEQRLDGWKNRLEFKGRKLRVKYQSLTQGKGVPRFPVALEVIGEGNEL